MPKKNRTTYVTPPSPIINRRTGAATRFGSRRAYDGAYILELLNASGCTDAEAATVTTVLQPLLENCDWITVGQLLDLLQLFVQYPDDWQKPGPSLTVIK